MLRAKLIPLLLLFSCSQTIIPIKDLDRNLLRINESNTKSIDLDVISNKKNLGVQFGFIVLPLGLVSLSNSQQWLYQALAKELILSGYKIEKSNNKLSVNLENLSCNVFDLLVIRWLKCSGKLNINSKEYYVSNTENKFSSFGFGSDLSVCLNKLGKKLALEVVDKLK